MVQITFLVASIAANYLLAIEVRKLRDKARELKRKIDTLPRADRALLNRIERHRMN
jgi:hypothetical protein